ncbi:MAG: hypothetical protein JNG85_01020 [Spirochaetaceae bacterium]|nr:hypothetical protein [Spirochaetaceae bacterium]
MRKPEDYRRLARELDLDADLLASLYEKSRRAAARAALASDDEFAWAALGYTLHNLYCLFENYFLRIAKFFENGLDSNSWHAELVDRMCVEIEGLRPRLFDRSYARRMDELRRFRHAFRNLYQSELDPRRLKLVDEGIPSLVVDFAPLHNRFTAALELLAAETEARE